MNRKTALYIVFLNIISRKNKRKMKREDKLKDVNIKKEYELIKQKKSNLSAAMRKIIISKVEANNEK